MLGSFATHISSNKADAFIIVGIALTVWFFALYYGGGLALSLINAHRLSWWRAGRMAAVLLVAFLLLWQITVLWLSLLIVALLVAVVIRGLSRRLDDKVFTDHLKAGIFLALAVGFWLMGLVMISLVLTGWQTAALTLGLASFGVCAWLADQARQRWAALAEANRRTIAVVRVVGFLVLGLALISTLIVTS